MKSRTRLSDFPFTFPFHALEKEMATHSSATPSHPHWQNQIGSQRIREPVEAALDISLGAQKRAGNDGYFYCSLVFELKNAGLVLHMLLEDFNTAPSQPDCRP